MGKCRKPGRQPIKPATTVGDWSLIPWGRLKEMAWMAPPDSQNLPTQGVRKLDIYTQLYEALFGGCQRPPRQRDAGIGKSAGAQ